MRIALRGSVACAALLLGAVNARGQIGDVLFDPALGNQRVFGPGGIITNGFGYNGPGGYYVDTYAPFTDSRNGPSAYYSPIFNTIGYSPPYTGGDDRAGWRLRPSLPFTGTRTVRLFRRRS